MTTPKDNPDFFIGEMAVGVLTGDCHDEPGLWSYEPYHGSGHYEMSSRIRAGEAVECRLGEHGPAFVVRSIPAYGVLEVSEVSKGDQITPAAE
jgi:hypothetical protein